MSVLTWLRSRKTAASATVLAVLVATPVTVAVLHPGFPISDVDLLAKNVWVTNALQTLTGRLNMQIEELNGGVRTSSQNFDVMQNGANVFVYDSSLNSIERVDPAYAALGQRIDVPRQSAVTYGGSTMTIVQPSDGSLWVVNADGELSFDPLTTPPVLTLGIGGQAVASQDGAVFAVSPDDGALYRIEGPGSEPQQIATVVVSDYAMTTVGAKPVILDYTANAIIKGDGGIIALNAPALRVQQPGPDRDYVVVATGDSLLKVAFGGNVETLDAAVSTTATTPATVAAPVVLGSCIHGAWVTGARYLGVCDGKEDSVKDVTLTDSSARLEFRVNRNVIALNNLKNGNAWLVTQDMVEVNNWGEVTPPPPADSLEGSDKSASQSFADTLAERTEQNRAPIARPDQFGVRPGKTTILSPLDNDTDPDGDVLTISNISDVSAALGVVEYIDGGRALQFVPAPGSSGTVSFRYTVSDGRPGGVAESQIDLAIRPVAENVAPVAQRVSQLPIELGQTITYNVLGDWLDPDGDDMLLTDAASTTGDIVRFRPDGQITFTNTSSEVGEKSVSFVVSDGTKQVPGEFIVEVKAVGELDPIGTPDFASTFVGKPVEISPLVNDRSPSGAQLSLVQVETIDDGITASLDLDRGVVTATAGQAGIYYLKYTLAAGTASSIGLIRVDVKEDPTEPLAPVAVTDTAYVRPNEPTSLAALANDQSPSGRVIGIQSIDLSSEASQLISVEVLNSSVLRITSQAALTQSVAFSYTVSDGISTSTAGVTVVPVPELAKHQAPIASDDVIKVRAGDIASVSVLNNDYHPDGARMLLDPVLVQSNVGADGLAFVTGDQVRIQAPSKPGQYAVTYRIYDAFEESAVASVVFTVLAEDPDNNAPPLPRPLTARVFQGGSVTIDVPLDGVDPDGDSVVLLSASGTQLGEVSGQSSTSFTYKAYDDTAGTDSFTYQVRDTFGEVATGTIQIGVIQRGSTVLPPSAVTDEVSIRPGRVASIPVLANDSDPNGYEIEIAPELLEVQEGITAEVDKTVVVVTAGKEEGTFSLRYAISNGKGGSDDAFVIVTVSKNAPLQPPSAVDHVLEVSEIVGLETVDVNVLDGAQNPGGLISDLVVTTEGAHAAAAEVQPDGVLRVTLGATRQAIAYRLNNEIDDLSAMAFVIVPAYTSDLPPTLKPELVQTPPNVSMNQTKEWKIADLLDVPSGREVRIINENTATAGRSNGDPIVVDQFTLRYTPETDFRGQTFISFEVTDGSSATDQSGSRATIQMAVTVGDVNFEDVPPTFSNGTVSIEAGEAATVIDLRQASSHPNPSILSQLTYADLAGSTSSVSGALSGSSLSISAPFGVQPGESATFSFTVNYKDFSVPGQIVVNVVASTRPLAQAVDDTEPEGRPSSGYVISPLTNDFNPFAADGQPLTIVGAQFEGATLGASLSSTASTVTVDTSTTKSGTISVIYTIRDATDTAAREVQGRLTVVVASAPEPVTSITLSNPASQTVNVSFQPPSSSNGAVITGYTVQVVGGQGTVTRTDCVAGGGCSFSGLTNGSSQSVTVAATNKVGTTWSTASTITPYGTPSVPTGQVLSTNSAYAPATITPGWSSPSNTGGGSITYNWNFTQGISASGSTPGTAGSGQGVGAGNYTFRVQACNPGGCSGYVTASVTITTPPTWTRTVDTQSTCAQQSLGHAGMSTNCTTPGDTWIPASTTVTVSCYAIANLNVLGENPSTWFYVSSGAYSGYYTARKTLVAGQDSSNPPGMPSC